MPAVDEQTLNALYDEWARTQSGGGRTQMPAGQSFGGPGQPDSLGSPHTQYYNPTPTAAANTGPGVTWINPMTGNVETLPPGVTPEMAMQAMNLTGQAQGVAGVQNTNVTPGLTAMPNPYTGGNHPNTGMPLLGGLIQPPAGSQSAAVTAAGLNTPGVAPSSVYNMNPAAMMVSQGDTAADVNPFGPGEMGINASVLSGEIWDNPQLALGLSGVAAPGTPGYNNLANLGFDPYAVYLASGAGTGSSTGVEYANWLGDMYATLGKTGDQGGASIVAGPLLQNLINMPVTSTLGKMMNDDPTVFYQMATQIMDAGGASPMAVKAFKAEAAQLYQQYIEYMVSVGDQKDLKPINQWIKETHPEFVASLGV